MQCLERAATSLPALLELIRAVVETETPTGAQAGIAAAVELLRTELPPGGTTTLEALPGFGPLLRFVMPGSGPRVLVLGHLDTVHPVGSWPRLWTVSGDRAYGPGVYDTKAGAALGVWALRLIAAAALERPTIELILTPDEEVGSPGSRPLIEEAARRAVACLVLEPAMPDGSLKLARKATAEYRVSITGRAAHQGVRPERGVNAVLEAAHQVLYLAGLEDPRCGTTVGPNVIRGGVVSNMVAADAEIVVDVRTWDEGERDRLDGAIRGLQPRLPGSEVRVSGGWNRPLMRPSKGTLELFDRVRAAGSRIGLDLKWVALGGGSDANFTSAVGRPTIDGLGAVGDNDHQPDEHIVVPELSRRLALLTETLLMLGDWDRSQDGGGDSDGGHGGGRGSGGGIGTGEATEAAGKDGHGAAGNRGRGDSGIFDTLNLYITKEAAMAESSVVVLGAVRTPIGAIGGGLAPLQAEALATHAIRSVLERTRIEPGVVEYTTMGWVMQDPRSPNVAKTAAELAGVPSTTPGTTFHENCASGGAAIHSLARRIMLGEVSLGVAGGAESMSNVPRYLFTGRTSSQLYGDMTLVDGLFGALTDTKVGKGELMGLLTERLVEKYGVSREDQDEVAFASHHNALDTWERGLFGDYVVPVEVPRRKGDPVVVERDEGPRPVTKEQLAGARPYFKRDGGTITTLNASSVNDAAAALVLASEKRAHELGIEPLARLVAFHNVGVPREYMGEGAFKVIPPLLAKAGVGIDEIHYFELNEAFAAVVAAAFKELPELPRDRTNQWGSGISLGHPVGCTGARQVVDMIHQLRQRGARRGLTTRCVGGGMGSGEILEVV